MSNTCPQGLGRKLQLLVWVQIRTAIKISFQVAYDQSFLPATCVLLSPGNCAVSLYVPNKPLLLLLPRLSLC